jgi:3-hydroxyisobutyrate dehydrogenase
MTGKSKKWSSLEAIPAEVWTMLQRGAAKARDPFHTPVLGTVGPVEPNLRMVVLRRVIEPERLLICHTDRRSAKVEQIRATPRVSWHFYHPDEKIQLRLSGQATLHTADELADRQWAATKLMSRRCYCALEGPGAPSPEPTGGLPDHLVTRSPTEDESETGRHNFVVISTRIDFLDWLFLRARGHRRAQFSWLADRMTATWVAP